MSTEKKNDRENTAAFQPRRQSQNPATALAQDPRIGGMREVSDHADAFFQWQKVFFENGASAFDKSPGPRAMSQAEQRAQALENKLKRKDEVIAEIMADYIVLKK